MRFSLISWRKVISTLTRQDMRHGVRGIYLSFSSFTLTYNDKWKLQSPYYLKRRKTYGPVIEDFLRIVILWGRVYSTKNPQLLPSKQFLWFSPSTIYHNLHRCRFFLQRQDRIELFLVCLVWSVFIFLFLNFRKKSYMCTCSGRKLENSLWDILSVVSRKLLSWLYFR